jgi:lysophospholipase L1-like esterase
MRTPLRKLAARLVLFTVSAIVTLLIAELAVRIVRPQAAFIVSQGLYEADPPRGYRLTPGFRGRMTNRVEYDTEVAINRQGLRGPEVEPLPPGGLRILVLGDSFAFGVGAEQEESYPARLEEILRNRGVRAQVLNAGVPGYSVPDAVTWFQAHGKALDPDVVLLTVFTGNDLQDAAPGGPKVVVKDGHLVPEGRKRRPVSLWFNQHSHLFSLLKSSALVRPVRRLLGRPEAFGDWVVRTEMHLYATDKPSDLVARGAAVTERAVADLVDLVRSAGETRVVAVIVPSLLQVDAALWKTTLDHLGLGPAKHDPDRTTRIVREMFERRGVPVLDLSGPFREAIARGERLYFPIDRHLTPEGYELMAQAVARAVPLRGEKAGTMPFRTAGEDPAHDRRQPDAPLHSQ